MNFFRIWAAHLSTHPQRSRFQQAPAQGQWLPAAPESLTFWSPAPGRAGCGLLVWSGRGKGSRGDGEGHSTLALTESGVKVVGFQRGLSTLPPFSVNPQEKCHPVVQKGKLCPQEANRLAQGHQHRGSARHSNPSCVSQPPSLSPHLPLQHPWLPAPLSRFAHE